MKTFSTKRKAFTLIELLIVIAIIGILFIVLVSKVDFATNKAKATGVQTDFKSFQMAFDTVAKENAGFNTFGWDTGDANQDGIRNSYDEGDNGAGGGIAKNGVQDGAEVFTGRKVYDETFTKAYSLKKNGTGSYDRDALNRLETAINANLDPKLHITIKDDGEIIMANGAQDPWNKEYHGWYITNAENDKKDRGAIVMYSDGANNEFGSEHTIANGVVNVIVPDNNKAGKDDYSIVSCYTYVNGYGEIKNLTTGFSNNQQFLTGNGGSVNSDETDDNVVTPQKPADSIGLSFSLNDDGQSYDVTGIGTCTDTDIVIPATYEGLPVTGLRTGISGGPFAYSNIRSIIIPDSVINISGDQFCYCSELKEVTIGSGVTYIDSTIFRYSGCINVNISKDNPSYKSIDGAVYTKNGKTLIYYPLSKAAIIQNIVIPEGVEIIPDYAFWQYYDIIEVTLPNSVTYIGNNAFSSCFKLEHIVMSNNITTIGQQAFSSCERLKDIVIPNSVVSIGEQAFMDCFKLTEVMNKSALDIEKGATTHGYVAYYAVNVNQSESSQKVNIDGYIFYTVDNSHYLIDYVGSNAELVLPDKYNGENYDIYQYAFLNNDNITKVIMSDNIISMGQSAFYRCNNLEEVLISNSITHISDNAFFGCQSLHDVTIPEGVLTIGDRVFVESGLQSIHLPNTITTIGKRAFGDCPLEQIVIPNSVTTIHEYAFYSDWTSWLINIYIDKPENSIAGAPWQAYRATIHWNSTGPTT